MGGNEQSANQKHELLNAPSEQPNAVPLSTPQFCVKGKNFIVTGGTQGLGRTIAEQLMAAGASGVVVANRGPKEADPSTEESLEGMREFAKKQGSDAKLAYVPFDVTHAEDAHEFVRRAEEEVGEIHGLVNAAGRNSRGDLKGSTVELWDEVMNVNARGPFFLIQAVADAMQAKGTRGSIVSISSVMAHGGIPDTAIYTISKASLDAVTKVAANQLKSAQIRVNAIHLGPCVTYNEDVLQGRTLGMPDWIERGDKVHPFGRMVRMIDVASVVGHLLSDASFMVTDTLIEMHPDMVIGTTKNTYPFAL